MPFAACRPARSRSRPHSYVASQHPSNRWSGSLPARTTSTTGRRGCIAAALGWPFVDKHVSYGPLAPLRGALLGATVGVLDPAGSDSLVAPWPDVLICSGKRSLPVARWIRRQSGGRTKLIQLGRPGGAFTHYDLIIASPDDRLPIRRNVLQVAGPITAGTTMPDPGDAVDGLAANLQRPLTALFLTAAVSPWVMNEAAARELGRAASADMARHGGSIVVAAAPGTSAKLVDAVRGGLPAQTPVLGGTDQQDPRAALLAAADRFIVASGDARMLEETGMTGRPVAVFDLPRWHDNVPLVRPLVGLVLKLFGGDTYRGTPLQQHAGGRALDWLTTRGLWFRPHDLQALYRSLEARGLAVRLGADSPVATPRPLDDLPRVLARVRSLLTEAHLPG